MRTKLLTLFLVASLASLAQNGLSNLSFETWSNSINFGPQPTGWFGFNLGHQTTGAQQGSSYVRITNDANSEGALLLGNMTGSSGAFKGGAPYNQHVDAVTGFYKTSGMVSGDTICMSAYTSKSGVINAGGTFTVISNVSSWTSFSMSLISFGNQAVDSVFMVASSGNLFNNDVNVKNSLTATLDLDNLSVGGTNTTTTGMDKNSLGTAFMVYPNPASGELTVFSKNENASMVRITDLAGRTIGEAIIDSEKTRLDLQRYEAGIYSYSILDKNGAALLTSKLMITR